MINAISLFVCLLATWLILSGFFSVFFVTLGVFSCLLSVIVARKMTHETGEIPPVLPMLFKLPSYLMWLEWEIIKSSIDVAIKMWQLEPAVYPSVGWIPTSQKNETGLALYANSITLTPGTVSVMVRKDMIQVHAIEPEGLESLRSGDMDSRVFAVAGRM